MIKIFYSTNLCFQNCFYYIKRSRSSIQKGMEMEMRRQFETEMNHWHLHCVERVRIRIYFGPHFSRIFPHSDGIWRDTRYLSVFSPNAGKSGKNVDQNNSEYGHFLRSGKSAGKKVVIRISNINLLYPIAFSSYDVIQQKSHVFLKDLGLCYPKLCFYSAKYKF